jgi:beta-N-acetylhexosaminidase
VTTDLAPVLDISDAEANGSIGDARSVLASSTAGRAGVVFMRGLAAGGGTTVGKQFPGHGATTIDSHHQLPSIDKTLEERTSWELVPSSRQFARDDRGSCLGSC